MKRRVMLYLDDDGYNRLVSTAKKAGLSRNAYINALLWQADFPKRKQGEVAEYECKRCGRRVWMSVGEAVEPDTCPYPDCGGVLVSAGRWLTLVLGRVE